MIALNPGSILGFSHRENLDAEGPFPLLSLPFSITLDRKSLMKKDPNSVTYREKIGWLSLRVEFYGTVKGGGRKLGNAEGGSLLGK